MNLENLTVGEIVALFVILQALGKGLDWLLTPFRKRADKDKSVDERFSEVDKKLDNDNKRLNMLKEDTKQILLSVNELLQHTIDNNHTDALKQRKKELDEYLIKR